MRTMQQQIEEATTRYIARRDPAADHEHVYDDIEGDPAICPQYACPFGVTEG